MNSQKKSRENIFLDFLNPELRVAWGMNENNDYNYIFFKDVLNISIFLTKEYCIIPPAFILEDPLTFRLVEAIEYFIDSGFISIPLKYGETFHSKLDKILNEYRNVKSNYANLENKNALIKTLNFLEKLNLRRVEKKADTTILIAMSFQESFHNKNDYWRRILQGYDTKSIDNLLGIPSKLASDGLAITHGEILNCSNILKIQSSNKAIRFNLEYDIHKLVHYEYGNVYMDEYNCISIYNLFHENTFSPTHRLDNYGYNFQIIRIFLETLNIYKVITRLQPVELIHIRRTCSEYIDFISNYFRSSNKYKTKENIERYLANLISSNKALKEIITTQINTFSIDYLADVLGAYNTASKEFNNLRRANMKTTQKNKIYNLAIFVALREEEIILQDELKLCMNNNTNHLEGNIGNTHIQIYSPKKMGRVYAALETYDYLTKNINYLPDMILIAGIAGGFEVNNVKKGDILIPEFIIDVSNTKKEGAKDGKDSHELIRWKTFNVNQELIHYMSTDRFNEEYWKVDARKKCKRVSSDIINIIKNPISCCDSVIKDEEWIQSILKIHPNIAGIEMESGGVCMAVDKFEQKYKYKIPISIMRGVSDLSNPYKADDEWRIKSMVAVTSLIETIKFESL